MPDRMCDLLDCDIKHYARGYCFKHYSRWRTHGDPMVIGTGHRYTCIDAATRLRERSEWRGDCLIYTEGSASRSGHVMIGYEGKYQGVHRVAWALAHGPAGSKVVRHTCDTPRCINIEHLRLGTPADNNRDRDERGRHRALRGETNGFAVLNESKVRYICQRLAEGASQRQVAREVGVTQSAVHCIGVGKSWAWLTGGPAQRVTKPGRRFKTETEIAC